jgi:hypothetical protein
MDFIEEDVATGERLSAKERASSESVHARGHYTLTG